jgi:hypothetical protein
MLASTARVVNHPPLDNWEEAWATKDRCAATGKEPSLSTRKRDLTPCRAAVKRAAQGIDLQRIPLPRGEGGRRPGEGLRVVSDETFRLSVTHKPQADAPHLSRDPPCQAPNARSRGRGQGVGEHQVVVIGRETAGNQARIHVGSRRPGNLDRKRVLTPFPPSTCHHRGPLGPSPHDDRPTKAGESRTDRALTGRRAGQANTNTEL